MQNRPLGTTLCFFGFLGVLVFRGSNPVNEETALEWIEEQGYSDVQVEDTGKNCYPSLKKKRKFKFSAVNIDGDDSSGTLCLSVVRKFSTLREK